MTRVCIPDAYQMQATHKSFNIMNSGLVLHPMYPFMGASPDGLVSCSCCGNGVVEIKCPYTCKDKEIHEVASERSNFCLHENKNGERKSPVLLPSTNAD